MTKSTVYWVNDQHVIFFNGEHLYENIGSVFKWAKFLYPQGQGHHYSGTWAITMFRVDVSGRTDKVKK